jgi:hypothetical protein
MRAEQIVGADLIDVHRSFSERWNTEDVRTQYKIRTSLHGRTFVFEEETEEDELSTATDRSSSRFRMTVVDEAVGDKEERRTNAGTLIVPGATDPKVQLLILATCSSLNPVILHEHLYLITIKLS